MREKERIDCDRNEMTDEVLNARAGPEEREINISRNLSDRLLGIQERNKIANGNPPQKHRGQKFI